MTELNRTHLDQLENQSIFIFREAYHAFKNIAMPWSMGKDSNVLIWLARKSFFGKVIHVLDELQISARSLLNSDVH